MERIETSNIESIECSNVLKSQDKRGNRCNSELCEKWPFVTLNQRAVDGLLVDGEEEWDRQRMP